MTESVLHHSRPSLLLVGVLVLLLAACGPLPASTVPPAASPLPAGTNPPAASPLATAAPVTIPPATATPGPTAPGPVIRVVTLADDGQTITLQLGDRLSLQLGQDYEWLVAVDDPAILGPVLDDPPAGVGQGVFQARATGQTTLSASGDPPCRKAKPPCGMPSRLFTITVVVQ